MITLLLANWRLIAIGAAIVGLFAGGWHAHSIYDGYIAEKASKAAIDNLGKGVSDIIELNQGFDKVVSHDKTDCANQPMPDGIRLLISK